MEWMALKGVVYGSVGGHMMSCGRAWVVGVEGVAMPTLRCRVLVRPPRASGGRRDGGGRHIPERMLLFSRLDFSQPSYIINIPFITSKLTCIH